MCVMNIVGGWYGRTCNNIITISNAIHINNERPKKCKKIQWPYHKYFKSNHVLINDGCPCDNVINVRNDDLYWCYRTFKPKTKLTMGERRSTCEQYKHDFLKTEILDNLNIVSYPCVVHIRSGDTVNTDHSMYQPQPLEYYTELIESQKELKNVCIVYEDDRIPVVNMLRKRYDGTDIVWQSSTLEKDLNTIIRAENLITSPGTFSAWVPYMLSETLKTMHIYKQRVDDPPMIFDSKSDIQVVLS